MGWTTPLLWTSGQLVTAAQMNTYVSDDFAYLKDSPTFDGSITVTGTITAPTMALVQTTTATGAQADFALNAGGILVVRCTGAAPVFSGFATGVAGRMVILECLGTTLKVVDQATSTAANQIICESTQGQIVGVLGRILLVYDATTARWRATVLDPGAPIAYTPTWTGAGGNPVINNGTLTGKYTQRGKLCRAEITVVCGNTTTFGSGVYSWALPLTAASANRVVLMGETFDASASSFVAVSRRAGATTGTVILTSTGTGSYSDTVPMTWADQDTLSLSGEYEIT